MKEHGYQRLAIFEDTLREMEMCWTNGVTELSPSGPENFL